MPFNSPSKFWDLYDEGEIELPYNNYPPKDAPIESIPFYGELSQYSDISKEHAPDDQHALKLIHGYKATVSYVDKLIGDIINVLKDEELYSNTIIVLVGDHGYSLREHTLWAKYNSYEEATKVPLLIKVPGKNAFATNAMVELVDIYPTIAELCNLELPKNQIEGKSLKPILDQNDTKGKDYIFVKTANAFSIISKDYSYTEYINLDDFSTITYMLYDKSNDIDENVNVANLDEYKLVVKEYQSILREKFEVNIKGK